MTIEIAQASDHLEITKMMRASKAHWGYSKEQMEIWKDEVMVTEAYIRREDIHIFKMIQDGKIMGFYSYLFFSTSLAYLDNLFLHPDLIGKGIGQQLMDKVTQAIEAAGADLIIIHSDPNAEPFYLKNGFIRIGKRLSSIPDRYLPIMSKSLR